MLVLALAPDSDDQTQDEEGDGQGEGKGQDEHEELAVRPGWVLLVWLHRYGLEVFWLFKDGFWLD